MNRKAAIVLGAMLLGGSFLYGQQQCSQGCWMVRWWCYGPSVIGDQGLCWGIYDDLKLWCDPNHIAHQNGKVWQATVPGNTLKCEKVDTMTRLEGRCPENCTQVKGLYPQVCKQSMTTPVNKGDYERGECKASSQ